MILPAKVPCRLVTITAVWASLPRLRVVVLHFRFVGCQFCLHSARLVPAGAGQILLRIGQQVCVERKLRLRDVYVFAVALFAGQTFARAPYRRSPCL